MRTSALLSGRWLMPLLLLTLLAGCATRPKIDWNARVGNYTYNQAVVELGPPDKFAQLNDGTVVSEWLIYVTSPSYFTYGYSGYWGSGPYWGGPSVMYGYPGPTESRWLRLVFGANSQLQSWRKFYR